MKVLKLVLPTAAAVAWLAAGAAAAQAQEQGQGQAAPAAAAPAATAPAATGATTAATDESWLDQQIPGQIAATVAATTDYVFRGISQTDNKPAVQGSLEYSFDSGFYGITPYFGFWGSNVDFNDGDKATVETDWSFGLRGTLPIADQKVDWNVGGIYYYYPGAGRVGGQASNYNYWEIPVSLTYAPLDFLSLSVSNYYSPEFFGDTGKANYTNGKVTAKLPVPWFGLSAFAGVGHQYIEHAKDYDDWTVGLTATVKKVDLTFQYTDTNLTQADLGGNKLSDARFVFTVGFAF